MPTHPFPSSTAYLPLPLWLRHAANAIFIKKSPKGQHLVSKAGHNNPYRFSRIILIKVDALTPGRRKEEIVPE
jgi:hypothetical protein